MGMLNLNADLLIVALPQINPNGNPLKKYLERQSIKPKKRAGPSLSDVTCGLLYGIHLHRLHSPSPPCKTQLTLPFVFVTSSLLP